MQINPYLSPCTKLKSKWIKDLHLKIRYNELIEEKVRNSLELTGTGEHFMNRTPSAQAVRSTINKWNLMKLKSFSMTKDTIIYRKQQATEWEKIFTNYTSDRGLISIQRTKTTKQNKQKTKKTGHQESK